MLEMLGDGETFGMVLRAKGILEGTDGAWYYFDMVPGEAEIRTGEATDLQRPPLVRSDSGAEGSRTGKIIWTGVNGSGKMEEKNAG